MKKMVFRADRLKQIMRDNGVDCLDIVADPINVNIFSVFKLDKIIYGKSEPTPAMAVKIAKVCNCSLDYLYGLSENPNPIGGK